MAPANKRTQSVGVKDVDQSELVKALAAYLKRLVIDCYSPYQLAIASCSVVTNLVFPS